MAFKNGEFSLHIWRTDPQTGVRTWCGQFLDEKSALTWKRKQANPAQFTINNVGPGAIVRQQTVETDAERQERKRLQQERYERIKRGEVEKVTRPSTRTASGATTPMPVPKKAPAKPKVEDTPEQKQMKEDAKGLLDQHKKDEAADLKSGINR